MFTNILNEIVQIFGEWSPSSALIQIVSALIILLYNDKYHADKNDDVQLRTFSWANWHAG